MRALRFGSYSTPTTFAGIPSFRRLKSMTRYCFRCPPPRLLAVIRPLLFRPPFLAMETRRLFSGVDLVISSNPETVWDRTPGDLGFNFLMGITAYTPSKISIFSPSFNWTMAFFQVFNWPTLLPNRLRLPRTTWVLT